MQVSNAHHTHGSFATHHKTAANAKANKHFGFGAMLSQMQASHTPMAKTETPKPDYAAIMSSMEEKRKAEICKKAEEQQQAQQQESEQSKLGANSQAIADLVSKNMNMLWDNSTKQPPQPPGIIVPNLTYTYIPALLPVVRFEDMYPNLANLGSGGRPAPAPVAVRFEDILRGEQVAQPSFRETMASSFMKDIADVLSKNGITLAPGEKFNISVDKYCKVTVTGDNAEKAKAIENILNSPADGKNWGLLLQKKYMEDDMMKNDISTIFNPTQEHLDKVNKMLLENYISNASGGTVSLDDLYLSADGKIMGLPPELDKLINSMEPTSYGKTRQEWEKQISEEYDSYKKQDEDFLKEQEEAFLKRHAGDPHAKEYKKEYMQSSDIIYDIPNADEALKAYKAGNKEEYVRIIVDGLMEKAKYADVKTSLTQILQKGVNNIPDATANMVLGNGGLVFG